MQRTTVEAGINNASRWAAAHGMLRVQLVNLTLPANWGGGVGERAYGTPADSPVTIFQLSQPVPILYGRIYQHLLPIDLTGLRLTGDAPAINVWAAADGGYMTVRPLRLMVLQSAGQGPRVGG